MRFPRAILTLILALAPLAAAHATCMMTCTDADAGDDPRHFGIVTVETSCAAPGGPVHRSRHDHFDECQGNELREQVCDTGGIPGAQGAHQRIYRCEQCDPVRRGVCLVPAETARDAPVSEPTQSCSSVSGGEGIRRATRETSAARATGSTR